MTAKQEINNLVKKYNLQKDDFLGYPHKLELENLKTTWYIHIEAPTRRCKWYSVYTRFENKEMWDKINKIIPCNTCSGKCNRFCYQVEEISDFIDSVLRLDDMFKTVIGNN